MEQQSSDLKRDEHHERDRQRRTARTLPANREGENAGKITVRAGKTRDE
jgi:hypothetical protein